MLASPPSDNNRQTDQDKSFFSSPPVSLLKGGGVIKGIGEKFAVNPVTDTGFLSVPIATSSGRSGFGSQQLLSYESGASSGPLVMT